MASFGPKTSNQTRLATLFVVILASSFAGVLASSGSRVFRDSIARDRESGCSESSGCPICKPDTCTGDFDFLTGPIGETPEVDRCVEYDGVPPAHCAEVPRLEYAMCDWMTPPPGYTIEGYCYTTNCIAGNPTAEVCTNPWYPPP